MKSHLQPVLFLLLSVTAVLYAHPSTLHSRNSPAQCKTFPGDANWPNLGLWELLNRTVHGSLIRAVPIAAVCHNGLRYSVAACERVTAHWTSASLHYTDPTSLMTPWYEGDTCIPTSDSSLPCTLGGDPAYVLNATRPGDVQTAVSFARNNNIRLVIKNTGHDFAGKSAGAGALSIWTHHLKELDYIESYNSSAYKGPAFKIGAGVQALDLYAAAKSHGVTAIAGEGETVGVAGGYILGGGHSPLSSIYGMAADHLLGMQVVTADGNLIDASASTNADLFWALSGSGPSTFGVVTSVTVKVYPVLPATGVTFSFSSGSGISLDVFWLAVRQYLSHLVNWAEAGTYHYSTLYPLPAGGFQFSMAPFFAPNKTIAESSALLAPWYAELAALNISIRPVVTSGSNFYDAWISSFALETVGNSGQLASRLFPKQSFGGGDPFNATFKAIRENSEAGNAFLGFNLAPTLEAGRYPNNSVNPAWRDTVLHALAYTSWNVSTPVSEIDSIRSKFSSGPIQTWRDASPGSGAYLNEAMVTEPDFQQAFYGSNYQKLYRIKQKWDPEGIFYATTAVGSEDWVVKTPNGLPTANGRLCKK